MGKNKGGRGGVVINIGGATSLVPFTHGAAYSGTKYGVVGFTLSMGVNLRSLIINILLFIFI